MLVLLHALRKVADIVYEFILVHIFEFLYNRYTDIFCGCRFFLGTLGACS